MAGSVRHNAVEAHNGEREPQQSHRRRLSCAEAEQHVPHPARECIIHRAHHADPHVRIDRVDLTLDPRAELARRHRRSQLHDAGDWLGLGDWEIEIRQWPLEYRDVLAVMRDTHHLPGRAGTRAKHVQALAQRIFPWPQTGGQRLVDDRDTRRLHAVVFGERSSAHDAQTQGREIVRVHNVVADGRAEPRVGHRRSFRFDGAGVEREGHRHNCREGDAFHARHDAETPLQRVVEGRGPSEVVAGLAGIEA